MPVTGFGRTIGCSATCRLRLCRREVTAILGPNGAGKTTLLRAVCGTLALREGSVSADAQIGYVPQALHADHAYSAIDMVLLGRSRYLGRFQLTGRKDKARARECLTRSGSLPSPTSVTIG